MLGIKYKYLARRQGVMKKNRNNFGKYEDSQQAVTKIGRIERFFCNVFRM